MGKNLTNEALAGFSKLTREERLAKLVEIGALKPDDVEFLSGGGVKNFALAEHFIENVIGYFQMPMGVVTNMRVDGCDYTIPMAVEETSIIAAASKTAKWIRQCGRIATEMVGSTVIGQIQIAKAGNFDTSEKVLLEEKSSLIGWANSHPAAGLVQRGGGVRDLQVRRVPTSRGSDMMVIHIFVDTCDAMGANVVNQTCEFLKPKIEELTGERVTMCILSNWVDSRLTRAKVEIFDVDAEVGEKIQEASEFAYFDPYRAATNNKGVLNGMDPILIATGNDWRAVEAGVHAHACRSGQYRSITRWKHSDGTLVGEMEAPIIVGIVGGVTNLHPAAKMSLRMMKISSAEQLSRIVASMGLVQNLGALRALTSVGIIEGHMKLHIKNLMLGAGANEQELPIMQRKLEEILQMTKRISLTNAIEVLKDLRMNRQEALREPLRT